MIYGILAGNKVHLSEIARSLNETISLKKTIDRLSRNLFAFTQKDLVMKNYISEVKKQINEEKKYMLNIIVSMIPVGVVGLFFKDKVEAIFGSGLIVVGMMLMLTAALLLFSYYAKPRTKEYIGLKDAFVIGLAQACAVMPGLSRSGSTIAVGLLLGNKKEHLAQFSFLMVIPPILGEALLDVLKCVKGEETFGGIDTFPLIVGFLAAFISGCIACKWMINLVKKGKLIYFGLYCAVVGAVILIRSMM